jgi:hypothetical protein
MFISFLVLTAAAIWLLQGPNSILNVLYVKIRPLILTCGNTGLDLVGKRYEFQAFIFELLVPKSRPSYRPHNADAYYFRVT